MSSLGLILPPVVYLISLLIVAYVLRDQEKNDSQYFLAGRKIGWLPAILSVVANETSVATVMIFPAVGYKNDFVLIWLCAGYIIGRGLVGSLFIKKLYENHRLSIYETIGGDRKGSVPLAVSYVFAKYIANGARYYIAGFALQQLFGLTVPFWLIAVAIIVAVYSLTGGIRAIVVTDQIQGSVIYAMGIFLVIALVASLNESSSAGISALNLSALNFFDSRPALDNDNYFLTLLIGGIVISIGTHGADQDMIQRTLATKDAKSAGRSIFFSGIGASIVILTYVTIGVLLRVTGHLDLNPRSPLVDYIDQMGLPVLSGCFAVLLLSTGMSSLDSAINSTGAIWKFVFKSDKSGWLWSVFSLVCLVCSALLFALLTSPGTNFLKLALGSMSYIHGGLIALLILFTFKPRLLNPFSIGGALASGFALTIVVNLYFQPTPSWSVQIIAAAAFSLITATIIGWLTRLRSE